MALRNLTEGAMYAQLTYWLTRQRDTIQAHPEIAWALPRMQQLDDRFVTHRRDPQSRLAEAREEATDQDAVHDDDLRAAYYALLALQYWARDAALKRDFEQAREAIFDGGLAMVNRGYTEEAAEAELVQSRMDDDMEALLQRHLFADNTVHALVERWRDEARRLGELDATRTEVEAEVKQTRGPSYIALRADWMTLVKAFRASLDLVPASVRRALLARLEEAEHRADAKAAARRAAGATAVDDPAGVLPVDGSEGRGDDGAEIFADDDSDMPAAAEAPAVPDGAVNPALAPEAAPDVDPPAARPLPRSDFE